MNELPSVATGEIEFGVDLARETSTAQSGNGGLGKLERSQVRRSRIGEGECATGALDERHGLFDGNAPTAREPKPATKFEITGIHRSQRRGLQGAPR
ncbi:MAG: hypothetical protein HC882_01225 [Acidobacteria bacterium]|nr:hypothetical protein [Acidobacteriota bacterium]